MQITPATLHRLAVDFARYLHARYPSQHVQLGPLTPASLRALYVWLALWLAAPNTISALQSRLQKPTRALTRRQTRMRHELDRLDASIDAHEDAAHQRLALDVMPESVFDNLEATLGADDALALSLVRWFKHDCFHWVDPVLCDRCGSSTQAVGVDQGDRISPDERLGGAGRVELFQCERHGCEHVTRFPRYNHLPTILHTRRGRCGEASNLFLLFLRAVGLRARMVWDREDHVWCEYWSPSAGYWVHVDPSEAAVDEPLLYARGWGKKQSYVVAMGVEGAQDVSAVYVPDLMASGWERRIEWDEKGLQEHLAAITSRRRAHLPASLVAELITDDASQHAWITDTAGRLRQLEARKAALPGRVSGPDDWKRVRRESGLDHEQPVVEEISCPPLLDFPSTSAALRTHGSAQILNSRLTLTPHANSQVGASWWTSDLLSALDGWTSEIDFRIRGETAGGGADGLALVCQVETAPEEMRWIGRDGACLGYDGIGRQGDWVVEIDTHQTDSDPPVPHISLHSPPRSHHRYALAATSPGSLPDVTDGSLYTLRIERPAEERKAMVLFRPQGQPWMKLFEVELPMQAQGRIRLGLTAATGGLSQAHIIERWRVWRTS